MQKIKIEGRSVQKLEWKRLDGQTEAIAFTSRGNAQSVNMYFKENTV